LASRRFHTIRNLTLPMKSFLVTSSGTFVGIIAADHASRDFEAKNNAERQWYDSREERLRAEELRGLSFTDRAAAFARREKYKIISATWVASMVGSFVLVSRNPGLTGQQKLVQARVYAQGLTLGVLCASAAFEISDQRRGRGILDSKKKKGAKVEEVESPSHQGSNGQDSDLWKDMVAAEEQRLSKKHQGLYEHPEKHQAKPAAQEKKAGSKPAEEESNSEDSDDEKKDTESEKKN
jgi:hypothetical protein